MKNKQGISLIVLVITIIVMTILVAAVVVSLNNTGIINQANKAVEDTNLKEVEQLAAITWAEEFMTGKRGETLQNAVLDKLKDYISKYDIEVTDEGIKVSKKDGTTGDDEPIYTMLDTKYFDFEFDTDAKTATITGIIDAYKDPESNADWDWISSWEEDHEEYYTQGIVDENGNLITNLILPDKVIGEDGEEYTVTEIGYEAFAFARSITSIIIPEGITTIYDSAFRYCTALEYVKLPGSLVEIWPWIFSGCSNLKSVEFSSGIDHIGCAMFGDCTELTSIVIPEGVEDIYMEAFYGCSKLESIVIPRTVTRLEWGAFQGCNSLTNVYFGGSEEKWNELIEFNDVFDDGALDNITMHYNHVAS